MKTAITSIGVIGLLITLYDVAWGWPVKPSIPPSKSTSVFAVSCQDIATGERLDCPFSLTITEDAPFSGGHFHGSPTTAPERIGGLRRSGDSGNGSANLSGNTARSAVSVDYLVPEVSGDVRLEILYSPPPGWYCAIPPDCLTMVVFNIGIPGLEPMPVSGEGHWRLTGARTAHPDNHYGTPSTKTRVAGLARDYFEQAGIAIGINDMSLVRGGLFDLRANWLPPHKWHRTGMSVDIDHLGINEKVLNKLAVQLGCMRYERDQIHYECR